MYKHEICNDQKFGELLNSLSPTEKHRLLNLTRKQLGVDISEGVGVVKSNFSYSSKDRKAQAKEMRYEAKALRAKARELSNQAKELM